MNRLVSEMVPRAALMTGVLAFGGLSFHVATERPDACNVNGNIELPSYDEAVAEVANMKFALSEFEAEVARDELYDADTEEEIEAALDNVYEPFDIDVEVGAVPETVNVITHKPDDLDMSMLQTHALAQVSELADTLPVEIEGQRGTSIYYTTQLTVNGRTASGAVILPEETKDNKLAILYNVVPLFDQPEINTYREVIQHERGHVVTDEGCMIGGNDDKFASLNPKGWAYPTEAEWQKNPEAAKKHINQAVKDKIVVSGAPVNRNVTEDIALTHQELITNGFTRCQEANAEVICDKLELLAARDAYIYGEAMLSLYVSRTDQTSAVMLMGKGADR